jgi:ferritin-like metal-binding protein YciE
MDELKKAYIKKLSKVLSMEETIIAHLPAMIAKSTNEDLQDGLSDHLEETKIQRDRLVEILASNGGKSMDESDEAFKLMLENASEEISQIKDPDVRDAVIIASAQSVEHLEIAKYGTLVEWARQLGDSESRSMLEDTLQEERAADSKLTGIAEGGIFTTGVNEKAAGDE